MLTLRVPTPTTNVITNIFGLAGLAAIVVAVGMLTDWRWGLLAAGIFLALLSVLAQTGITQDQRSTVDGNRNQRAG